MSAGVPVWTIRPSSITTRRSAITIASRAVWVTTMLTPLKACRWSRSMVRTPMAAEASSAAVGSSSNRTVGSLASARAIATR
jgi:hypothetical protein